MLPRYFTFDFPADVKRLPKRLTYSVVSKHGLGIIETINETVARDLAKGRFFEIGRDRFEELAGPEHIQAAKVPSFLKQTKWKAGLFEFPSEPNICHTNTGLEFIDGHLNIFSRRITYAVNAHKGILSYQSRLEILRLNPDMSLAGSIIPEVPNRYPHESWEDPRVLIVDGQYFIGMATHICRLRWPVRQCLVWMSANFSRFTVYAEPKFGGNNPIPQEASGPEKNWTWFTKSLEILCIYTLEPLCVFALNELSKQAVPVPSIVSKYAKWNYGIIRGGTNPEIVDGEYWMFFHSSLPWVDEFGHPVIPNYRRYYVGAITMSMDEPYRITSMTKQPLLVGSEEDSDLFLGPPAIFPCGAKLVNGDWLVTMGINEEKSAWIAIPHAELKTRMETVQ